MLSSKSIYTFCWGWMAAMMNNLMENWLIICQLLVEFKLCAAGQSTLEKVEYGLPAIYLKGKQFVDSNKQQAISSSLPHLHWFKSTSKAQISVQEVIFHRITWWSHVLKGIHSSTIWVFYKQSYYFQMTSPSQHGIYGRGISYCIVMHKSCHSHLIIIWYWHKFFLNIPSWLVSSFRYSWHWMCRSWHHFHSKLHANEASIILGHIITLGGL